MMKKLALLLSIALTVVLVPTSYGTLIGNFEGGLDGWAGQDATVSQDTIGATTGTGSMKIVGPKDWKITSKFDVRPFFGDLQAANQISMDVTVFDADNPGTTWMQVDMVINGQNYGTNNNIGWNMLGSKDVTRDGIPHTFVWDISAALQTKLDGATLPIDWLELMIISNKDGQNAQFYVDNIQLIPEPATMCLLGMGGLALLRRRK